MCDKAVDGYSIALKFVLDRYKSKEMCDKNTKKNTKTFSFMTIHAKRQWVQNNCVFDKIDGFIKTHYKVRLQLDLNPEPLSS